MNKLKPIFIISLPRSGSTLLQRVLTRSPEVHSVAETWLLLPFAFMLKQKGVSSLYNYQSAFSSWTDFINELPNGVNDFQKAVKEFSLNLYSKVTPSEKHSYFIDKTPRYYLIIRFLSEVFPNAKFIFLFRHPLQVVASILTTWLKNRFSIYKSYIDIYGGPKAIAKGYERLKDRSISIQYEDLIISPEAVISKICDYLQIEFHSDMIDDFTAVNFKGRMGDQTGSREYGTISTTPLIKWKKILNNQYRVLFSKYYIKLLGDNTLNYFKTSVDATMDEIETLDIRWKGSFNDLLFHSLSIMKLWSNWSHFKRLSGAIRNRKHFFPYL